MSPSIRLGLAATVLAGGGLVGLHLANPPTVAEDIASLGRMVRGAQADARGTPAAETATTVNLLPEDPACGAVTTIVNPTPPTTDLCAPGATLNPPGVVGSTKGPWTWRCKAGGLSAACWTSAFVNTATGTTYGRWAVAHAALDNPYFFPTAVFWQYILAPVGNPYPYSTLAAGAAAAYVNIFYGIGGGGSVAEFQALAQAGEYAFVGIFTPYDDASEALAPAYSVGTILANANTAGASANLLGYMSGDEATCAGFPWPGTPGKTDMSLVPAINAGISAKDPSRMAVQNDTVWMAWYGVWGDKIVQPGANPNQLYGYNCLAAEHAALQSSGVASEDSYPLTSPYLAQSWGAHIGGVAKSDFLEQPNDTLWFMGMAAQSLVENAGPGQATLNWIEAGGDNLGFSWALNAFTGAVTAGSATLVNFSHWSLFTTTWLGLTVTGPDLRPGTKIVSITDSTHAVLSAPATKTNNAERVVVTGGTANPASDCQRAQNLCVVQGNQFRPTPDQVNAEAWSSIINGAIGVGYFCHDRASGSASFCLGATTGGASAADVAASAAAFANLQYVNSNLMAFAPVINAPTVGKCSMQQTIYSGPIVYANPALTTSCAGGVLAMRSSGVPGMALVKQLNGVTYLFAQSDRRSAHGGIYKFTLAGLSGQIATVIYDSNTQYDPSHATLDAAFRLDPAGAFIDILGANGDDYQVRIYAISPAS